ncbi:MAG: phenylalanine--tRNA ligase subunit beta [Candidatus Nanoarchaeia archaeon]|jgi:phenylalanyl-tRNA synthetase beta chain|nr:phenylalanine--tRNA ligase subunit beta [Candidatus Nanoarchaeia archaeon]|tara:strand:- start:7890 stop:9545 length:1656 start_codon:yes stop_codon:yes gene_type:complete
MPTISINKKEFEKYVGKKLSLDKLKDRISYLGTDLEKVDNNEIIVEIFPDRPDMLSLQGFARAFSSFISVKKGLRKYNVKKSDHKVIVDKSVDKYRPYTVCAIIKNLKFSDEKIKEIIDIQEKLHITYGRNRKKAAIGVYPFEKIKTPIVFIASDPKKIKFIPLGEKKELNGLQVLNQTSSGREYAHLLEGMNKFPYFIDANNEVLSMPPIINSDNVGNISNKTKDVFIECSGFDFNILKKCLNMIVTSLADMGGEIYSMEIIYGNKKIISPNLEPEKMKLDLKYMNKLLGLNLKEKDVKKYLERMGYDYSKNIVLIPAYRSDIMHQVDIIEDIAITYGYENFKEEIPNVATIGEENNFEVFKNKIANLLVGFNLSETSTYHLINEKDLCENMLVKTDYIELEKASSSDYNILRTWVTPSLLQVLRTNKHNEYPQNLFEIGTVFNKNKEKIEENDRLAITLCHSKANFTEIKQILDSLFDNLGLKYKIDNIEHNSFIPGRVGRVSVNGKKVAYIGEINPLVLSNFGLEMPVSVFELNLTELFKLMPEKIGL